MYGQYICMARSVTLNKKRLTRREVQALLAGGHNFNAQVTLEHNLLFDPPSSDMYDCPDGNFLLVFKDTGKGDIWPREIILRENERNRREAALPQLRSMHNAQRWFYFSRAKNSFSRQIAELASGLFPKLGLREAAGNYSYASMDALSAMLNTMPTAAIEEEWYDDIVAYTGEVMRGRMPGSYWHFIPEEGENYPFIRNSETGILCDPIVPLWMSLIGGSLIDLRAETRAEMRRKSQLKGRALN